MNQRDHRFKSVCFLAVVVTLIGEITLLTASVSSNDFLRRDGSPTDRNRRMLRFTHLSHYLDPKVVERKPDASQTAADDGDTMSLPSSQNPGGGRRQLIHVFNPYSRGDDGAFSPVGYEQWIMLASVRDAQRAYNGRFPGESGGGGSALALFHSVTLVCAVVENNLQPLSAILAK